MKKMTEILFGLCNSGILLFWGMLLFLPKQRLTQKLLHYPWVPAAMALCYSYFLIAAGGLPEIDFTSLEGISVLFSNPTPEAIAAGWIHYLAFDYWVGCSLLAQSQQRGIPHLWMILPLLATFMLGPVGVLLYVVTSQVYPLLKSKNA